MARGGNDPSTGFREFWESKEKSAASRNLTFVQVEIEPAGGLKKRNKRRISKTPKAEEIESPTSKSQSSHSRRQQVWLAQRRHRLRKAEYAQSLEDQIARLRDQYTLVQREGHSLAIENAAISRHLILMGVLNQDELAAPPSRVLCGDDSFGSDPLPSYESMGWSGSDSEETQRSSENKSYDFLEQSNSPDPQMDGPSRAKIKQCRDLLLKDIHPFEDEAGEEKKTWEALADLVLEER